MRAVRGCMRTVFWTLIGVTLFIYICSVTLSNQRDISESFSDYHRHLRYFTHFNNEDNLKSKPNIHEQFERNATANWNIRENKQEVSDPKEQYLGEVRQKALSRDMDNRELNPVTDLTLICASKQHEQIVINTLIDTLDDIYREIAAQDETVPGKDDSKYAFNVQQSRMLPLNRTTVETRPRECLTKDHLLGDVNQYSNVSIIIPFHNEEYSVLLRTLHSIYLKTPIGLIGEVILLDDNSTLTSLTTKPFENYVREFPKLRLYRNNKRQGLIRTRILGAMLAESDTIVFMDAHIECQEGWLPPLLHLLKSKPTSIAVPAIDYINPYTLQYSLWSKPEYGVFSWELDFVWKDIPVDEFPDDKTAPIASPVTIGCAAALKRDYFFSFGGFDEDMWIWGGENIEISFRAWMCGGGVYIAPCSHVGHLFRPVLPYSFPVPNAIAMNLQRVAETWMGEYKKHFYQTTGRMEILTRAQKQSLKRRQHLKETLQCKSFNWYLENVVKDMPEPTEDAMLFGQLTNLGSRLCLGYRNGKLQLEPCPLMNKEQWFYYKENTKQLIHYASRSCLNVNASSDLSLNISMNNCSKTTDISAMWLFDPIVPTPVKNTLKITNSKRPSGVFRLHHEGKYDKCLKIKSEPFLSNSSQNLHYFVIDVQLCDHNDVSQYWMFTHSIKRHIRFEI